MVYKTPPYEKIYALTPKLHYDTVWEAGIYLYQILMDSRLRGSDGVDDFLRASQFLMLKKDTRNILQIFDST